MRPFLSFMLLILLTATNLHSQVHLKDYSTKINDTCWRIEYYNPGGPLYRIETYKDKKKKQAYGRFAFYDENGRADSSGWYVNGLREGSWTYFDDEGKAYLTKEYSQGAVVSEKTHEKLPEGLKEAPLKPGEIESAFVGGSKGWQQYLNKNLRYPREAFTGGTQGEVKLMFVVNKEGLVEDLWVFKSVAHSLDEESQRLIADSPKWTPAFQDGRIVKSYKLQPIRYRLQ
jgi:protein TonB